MELKELYIQSQLNLIHLLELHTLSWLSLVDQIELVQHKTIPLMKLDSLSLLNLVPLKVLEQEPNILSPINLVPLIGFHNLSLQN